MTAPITTALQNTNDTYIWNISFFCTWCDRQLFLDLVVVSLSPKTDNENSSRLGHEGHFLDGTRLYSEWTASRQKKCLHGKSQAGRILNNMGWSACLHWVLLTITGPKLKQMPFKLIGQLISQPFNLTAI